MLLLQRLPKILLLLLLVTLLGLCILACDEFLIRYFSHLVCDLREVADEMQGNPRGLEVSMPTAGSPALFNTLSRCQRHVRL